MISARRIADRVAMLYKGEIIWTGAIADIEDSGNLLVDQFAHGSADRPIQMEVWAL
jgi:phospholipid/cholesterol/gamma-HCH transport system ATP-binding protein